MSTQSLLMAGPELTETDIAGTEDSTFRPFDDELRRFVDDGKISMKADDLVVRVSGGKVLLDRVTFPIPERSLLGVIGPSGAGKSTLIGALTGMRPADSGTVRYDDVPRPADVLPGQHVGKGHAFPGAPHHDPGHPVRRGAVSQREGRAKAARRAGPGPLGIRRAGIDLQSQRHQPARG